MTKLAVYRRAGDGNRRPLKRRDAFQIDQTRHEISLLTTSLRDDERTRDESLSRVELDEKKNKKYQDSYGWGGEGGSKSVIKILLLQI